MKSKRKWSRGRTNLAFTCTPAQSLPQVTLQGFRTWAPWSYYAEVLTFKMSFVWNIEEVLVHFLMQIRASHSILSLLLQLEPNL